MTTIHAAVRAMARRQPTAAAVSDGRTALTYAELDHRGDRLAAALRRHGIGRGDRVGVHLPRCTDLVVSLLGVLKSGAAYVPLDPRYPQERLRYVADAASVAAVLTGPDGLPGWDGGPALLDPAGLAPSDAPAGSGSVAVIRSPARVPDPEPADPAYVIFTSGSTGRPKGVVIPHRNVVALLDAVRDDLRLGGEDVWTFFHSVAFDFSVWEIWGCLLTGGRLVVVDHDTSRSPEDFHRLLAAERVTVLSQTPSAFGQLLPVDARSRDNLGALRLVVFGGESLDARVLRDWFRRHPADRCRMVNMYGITETTVHVTARTLTPADAERGTRSVGPPLAGWSVSVRDDRGEPLPTGEPGEIYVGGAGVALGYVGRGDLTAERFVPDAATGERIYRTGDRGRLRPDGELEHLGRLDSQVKLRGFRIELDEIRSVLLDDPAVSAAAVVLGGTEHGDPARLRLDAYLVLTDHPAPADPGAGSAPTSPDDGSPLARHGGGGAGEGDAGEGDAGGEGGALAAVRERARRMLPEYMVPSTFTAVPRLPLTDNGKLDTARLPAPAPAPPPSGAWAAAPAPSSVPAPPEGSSMASSSVPAPSGASSSALAPSMASSSALAPSGASSSVPDPSGAAPVAATVRRVWREVLGVDGGPHATFFELGGNSLLAVRLLDAMRAAGLPRPTARDLYLNPTLGRFVALVSAMPAPAAGDASREEAV